MKKAAREATDRMISGKLRNKTARATHATVTVDGTSYAWARRHAFGVWGKAIEAVSLSVWLQPGRTRELILDFDLTAGDDAPAAEPRVLRALEDGIRAAIEGGWDPGSRGRAFRFQLEHNL